MLNYELDRAQSILIVKPVGPLESRDFEKLVGEVDPYISEKGQLNGLMSLRQILSGMGEFRSLPIAYEIRQEPSSENQKDRGRNRKWFSSIMPQVANHFVQAEIRHFDYDDKDAALN
jgi:hypothetical protein